MKYSNRTHFLLIIVAYKQTKKICLTGIDPLDLRIKLYQDCLDILQYAGDSIKKTQRTLYICLLPW